MAKGTLTLRDKALVVDSREAWAARFGGTVGRAWSGSCRMDANRVPHVHARRNMALTFNIDPRTGRWLRPGEPS